MREQLRFLLSVLGLVILFLVARELYRWVAYREERALIVALRTDVVDAGARVTVTRQQLDSLRTALASVDARLQREVDVLRGYERRARHRRLPPDVYEKYLRDRARYEQVLEERNALVRTMSGVLDVNHSAVERYNTLADSVRAVAARVGDPYYRVPLPVEAAMERGITVRRR